jgi:ketosteroid isomerase-like protein
MSGAQAEEIRRVLATIARERDAVAAGSSDEYFKLLDRDAVFMPPMLLQNTGSALRQWLKEFLEHFTVEWLQFLTTELVVLSEYAIHSYSYRWKVSPRGSGQGTTSSGKGVHILRRERDGSWLILREIWNVSPDDQQ